ncbi:MAG: phenylalanine--tRNA ligase subunit alpha [Zestosphaera sp.]
MLESLVLPPRQFKLVKYLCEAGVGVDISEVSGFLGVKESDLMRDLIELESKQLIKLEKTVKYLIGLSKLGLKYLELGLPEERVLKYLMSGDGKASLEELASIGLDEDEIKASLGHLRKYGLVKLEGASVILVKKELSAFLEEVSRVKELLKTHVEPILYDRVPEWAATLKRRKLVEVDDVKLIKVYPTQNLLKLMSEGKVVEGVLITNLTSEALVSGAWKKAIFKEFDVGVEVPARTPRLRHHYTLFVRYIKEILVEMGFEEVRGPYVESCLWNFDALFVPQYHPSRKETDVYYVDNARAEVKEVDVLERTKKVHEGVWKYGWREDVARMTVLRTHTTPVSLRTIYERGAGEYRVFSFDRVFRPDTPDPTHLMEFHQLEGIIVGKKVTFRELLGFFKELAKRLGMEEVRFKPAYFPFTEPSVEGFVKHPKLGWIEVFPGGMFRPEVLASVALPPEYKVAAWGIGIDRLAMIVLGFDDIRNLYSCDLDIIESTKIPEVILRNA